MSKSQPVEVAYCRFLKNFDLNFNVMKIVWAALGRRISCCNFVFVFKVIRSTGLRQSYRRKGQKLETRKEIILVSVTCSVTIYIFQKPDYQ